jgi:hypothetical protein
VLFTLSAPTAHAGSGIASIVEPYLRVQQRLSADSVEGMSALAESIVTAASTLGEAGDAIRSAASDLGQATDLKAARTAFARLTDAVLTFASASGATLENGVRVAYCPMARKHWLQRGEAIRNPFYGSQMLDCGRLVEGIPNPAKK